MCVFVAKKCVIAYVCPCKPGEENVDPNLIPIKQMKGLVSTGVAKSMIEEKKFKKMKREVVEKFISESGVVVSKIQEALDVRGASRKEYASIFNVVSSTLKAQLIKHVKLLKYLKSETYIPISKCVQCFCCGCKLLSREHKDK